MTASLHRCAAEECRDEIPRKHLMCLRHWRMVPAAIQREVLEAWRRLRCGGEVVERYTKAVKQAVAAVREKEIKRDIKKHEHGDTLNF